VFYGLSAFCADLLIILGPLVILSVEAARISDWLARRRLDPLLHPAIPEPVVEKGPAINVAGLLDEASTERIRMTEWLKGELAATKPPAVEGRTQPESVLVGGGVAADSRTRQKAPKARKGRGSRP
jgi:hypothetical protein